MLVVIRGAGDIATGIALRLYRAGLRVVMTETASPTAIRRTVAFSECVRTGETRVEDTLCRGFGALLLRYPRTEEGGAAQAL